MRQKAFTLVEIMIVVAIITVLATLATSMMVRNRITTNETMAIASCRTIVSACQSYYAGTIPHTYPDSLGTLAGSAPSYIDSTLGSGLRSGYRFLYQRTSVVSFWLRAEPLYPRRTGIRYFYTDETGRITSNSGARAGPNDPAI